MTSSKPYLLEAIYQWIIDNQCTPHVLVNADFPRVTVPSQFVKDGKIVLNIDPNAVQHFALDIDHLAFSARFSGTPMDIYLPMGAILGLYAKENGKGMMFEPEMPPEPEPNNETNGESSPATPKGKKTAKSAARSHLHVIK